MDIKELGRLVRVARELEGLTAAVKLLERFESFDDKEARLPSDKRRTNV